MISFTYASDNGFPFFDARNYVRFGFVRIDHEIDKLRLDRFKIRSLSVRAVRFTRNEKPFETNVFYNNHRDEPLLRLINTRFKLEIDLFPAYW